MSDDKSRSEDADPGVHSNPVDTEEGDISAKERDDVESNEFASEVYIDLLERSVYNEANIWPETDERSDADDAEEDVRLDYLSDEALTKSKNIEFGHEAYVDVLEEVVHSNAPPWHVGLFGTWGAGKSSIVNLLSERIKSSRENLTLQDDRNDAKSRTDDEKAELSETPDENSTPTDRSNAPDVEDAENSKEYTNTETAADGVDSEEDRDTEDAEQTADVEEPNYNFEFPNTAYVKVDAWQHDVDSVRTGILLDLNRALAKAVSPRDSDESEGFVSREQRHWVNRQLSWIGIERPHPRDELLDPDEILNTLHDIEEVNEQSFPKWLGVNLWEVFKKIVFFAIVGGTIVGGILILNTIGVLGSPLTLPDSWDPTTGLIALILITALSTALKQLFNTQSAASRTLVNPRRNWAGAYEDLFDDILGRAKSHYESYYGESLEKIVIVIDDLDRCESQTVYETLIAFKSFLENDDCIFIIPCDEDALYRHIQAADDGTYLNDQANQRDFLAKFFETQIRITKPSDSQIESFALDKLDELNVELADSVVEDVLLEANLTTPRRIIQAINRSGTMRVLAENRDVDAIQVTNPDHVEFLAKIAVLQEDYPVFHEALVEGRMSLRDLIDPEGEDEVTVAELASDLDVLDISREQRRRLAEFLIATDTVYQPPGPYLRLLGEKIDLVERFERALDHGRIHELKRRISNAPVNGQMVDDRDDEDRPSQKELLELVTERLKTEDDNAEYFDLALEISSEFVSEHRNVLTDHLFEVLGEHGDRRIELLDNVEFNDLELLADSGESERIVQLLNWYIDAAISKSELDEANLHSLYRFVSSMETQLRGIDLESVRENFAENVHMAVNAGTISRIRYQRILDTVSREYQPLYSRKLVKQVH